MIEQHQHELIVTFSPEPIWLDADPVRLAQVLANLLNNERVRRVSRNPRVVALVPRSDRATSD